MNPIFDIFPDRQRSPSNFSAIRVSLANPELIRKPAQEGGWSWGEIRKPETINYRTFKPEHDGLFCARIFGPIKDYECLCGKYKRIKHRKQTCEKCKVEVISSKVRRERLGHIDLAAPVAHIWFLKSLPSRIGNLLDVTLKDVESVLYCLAYIITRTDEQALKDFHNILPVEELEKIFGHLSEDGPSSDIIRPGIPEVGQILKEEDYHNLQDQYALVTDFYCDYLRDHIPTFKRSINQAKNELKILGADDEAQQLRYLIANQGRFYSKKTRVDSVLRAAINQWIDTLHVKPTDVRLRDKLSVISWSGERIEKKGTTSAICQFEPVAGDDLKSADRFVDEAQDLIQRHIISQGEAVIDPQSTGTGIALGLYPLTYTEDGTRSSGISVFVQGFKGAKANHHEGLGRLLKTAVEHIFGDITENLSTRVESALHTKITIQVDTTAAKELRQIISSQSELNATLRNQVADIAQKLIPANRVSVIKCLTVETDGSEKDLYHSVAGDEVSNSPMVQEKIRELVVKADQGVQASDGEVDALVIRIPAEKGDHYYLYLQSLKLSTLDLSNIQEIYKYAIKHLTRGAVVSTNPGRVTYSSNLSSLEVTLPPEMQYHHKAGDPTPEVRTNSKAFKSSQEFIVMNNDASAEVNSSDSGISEQFNLRCGDTLRAVEGDILSAQSLITSWSWPPFQSPVLSTHEGVVVFKGMSDEDKTLDGTGKGARVSSVSSKKANARVLKPTLEVHEAQFTSIPKSDGLYRVSAGRKVLVKYELPKGSILKVNHGDLIGRGQALALVESSLATSRIIEKKVSDQISNKLTDQLSRFPSFTVQGKSIIQSNASFQSAFGFEAMAESGISVEKFLGKDATQLYNETRSNKQKTCLIEDWSKGAQYLHSKQKISLLSMLTEDGALFFVLQSRDLSTDLAGVLERLSSIVDSMEAEYEYDDHAQDTKSEHLFSIIFKTFDAELIGQVIRLLKESSGTGSWTEVVNTLLVAARFNQYLLKRQETDGYHKVQFFEAEMGAEAVRKRLRTLDIFSLYKVLTDRIPAEALVLMDNAFDKAYFFDYVDDEGFDELGDLPDGVNRPDQGEVWSESDYNDLVKALKNKPVSSQHRPLFKALPTQTKEDTFILYNLSPELCKSFKVTLGQEMNQEQHSEISKRAFISGQTDIYNIQEISSRLALRENLEVGQEISFQRYLELNRLAIEEEANFVAQVAFEAEEVNKARERFHTVLTHLPIRGFERLSHSIRRSSDVSADLGLRKQSDHLIDMVRWLDTLDKLKAFEINPQDAHARSEHDLLDELRCSYFQKSDPRELNEGQLQSREWFLLSVISEFLRIEMLEASDSRKKKYIKRLKVVDAIRNSELVPEHWGEGKSRKDWLGNKPEWMILEAIPVIPPDLRPLVPLEGGRFATSDLNDLYRRVINRNNRLRRLAEELLAPEIIQRNEKRMLQEAVDALFDNGRKGKPITGPNKRPFKSLSAMIKGKQGRFRQNLLGKRVDYSGRSVIVVGPELRLQQCGLPKKMALELFKPFILSKLTEQGHANTIKAAKKKVDDRDEKVWDILDEVIQEHPVLLNRAPTLHRLGIQAFEPKLIEGKAIQLHPLVCTAFNADFDGDQMAVHLPLSIEAQIEARVLMMSSNNILSPANGKPIIVPSQDIVLGCYYMTRERYFVQGEGHIFSSPQEARVAYEANAVNLQAKVKCRIDGEIVETTVGRLLMSEILPPNLEFSLINKPMGKKDLAALIDAAYRQCTAKETVLLADAIKDLGYAQATLAGISIALVDLNVSDAKKRELVEAGYAEVAEFQEQAREGTISLKERYNKVIDKWTQITESVAQSMLDGISKETFVSPSGESKTGPSFNSVHIMADSGARGGPAQIRQLAGMRGLMAKPSGEIIETPITANFREGLSVLEYFISAHGARKGLADTALKTANSGYLTRRLVDVAQDAIITEYDCREHDLTGGKRLLNPIEVRAIVDGSEIIDQLSDRVLGRVSAEDVYNEVTSVLLIEANTLIDEAEAQKIDDNPVNSVFIRSPLTCETRRGVCVLCYGRDLARGRMVNLGEAVGVIAAQSIGEPGTQLTMRTFHIGGAASQQARKNSIVCRTENGTVRLENAKLATPTTPPKFARQGKQTVIESSSKKTPKFESLSHKVVINRTAQLIIQDAAGVEKERHPLSDGYNLDFVDGSTVRSGQRVAYWDPFSKSILSEVEGVVIFENIGLEEGTLKEERENPSTIVRRITAPPRQAKSRAIKGSRRSSKASTQARTPRIKICTPVFEKKETHWVVTAGNVISFKAQDGSQREAVYDLPVGAKLDLYQGDLIGAGQAIAKTEVEVAKTKDITGGLPRVAELFEARAKEKSAVLAQIDGRVTQIIGESTRRTVLITSDDPLQEPEEHLIKGQQVIIREGDFVKAGEALSDGPISPHEILKVDSERAVAEYLVNEIQQVYRLQGVKINDKHIEVIVRQMLRRVRIKDVGDTQFLPDEQVEKWILDEENARLEDGKRPAVAEPLLLGITKASLATESFISASSFQETTKVLTAAALKGKIDYLHGLKENVIMGRLIPAGTGLRGYQTLTMEIHPTQVEEPT